MATEVFPPHPPGSAECSLVAVKWQVDLQASHRSSRHALPMLLPASTSQAECRERQVIKPSCWWWCGMRCRLSAAPQAPREQPQEAEPCLRIWECHYQDALTEMWVFKRVILFMHALASAIFSDMTRTDLPGGPVAWCRWSIESFWIKGLGAMGQIIQPPTQKLPLPPLHPHSTQKNPYQLTNLTWQSLRARTLKK